MSFLDAYSERYDLWDDPVLAQRLMRERERLSKAVSSVCNIQQSLDDAITLMELGEAEGDVAVMLEAAEDLRKLSSEVSERQADALLSCEADGNDAYLEIHAGAGGTESQDWAEMLLRMYARWSAKRGYQVEVIERLNGEEAGLKSATIIIKGVNAYGWLKSETGVHRLVRISPFDSNARRHTSFSSVWVYPVVDDNVEVEIKSSDCRIDTYRSSGAGGQHVNTTDSAVRITHFPTGIVVTCQQERSQHQNKAQALSILRAKLYELELQKKEKQVISDADVKQSIGWGNQIRSYVLQPYQMVKDLRTGVVSTNPIDVLNGNVDKFMEAALVACILDKSKITANAGEN